MVYLLCGTTGHHVLSLSERMLVCGGVGWAMGMRDSGQPMSIPQVVGQMGKEKREAATVNLTGAISVLLYTPMIDI